MSPDKNLSPVERVDTGASAPTSRSGGSNTLTNMLGAGALAFAAMNSPALRAAEDWQDQGTTNNANADGEYIWCYGGDANGVHVRQIWDYGDGTSTTQIHDGTATGTHVDGLDAAIEAYDSSINAQEICVEDLDEARDEIKFYDFGNSQSFVVNDYIGSGSISSITYLTGSPSYSGNMHDGRYFMADYSGSNPIGAYEQFEGSSATEYYVHNTDDLVTVVVNPDTDQVFAAKDYVTGEVFKYDNASTSSVTEDALGVYGEPRSWRDAADSSTGYNSFSTLYDGEVHTIADVNSAAVTDPDEDGDGEAASVDCDDTNAAINSSADEECDGVDNNCDGSVDGTDSIDVSTWYIDNDGDGVGGTSTQEACDAPSGYVATGGDYDDNDASVQTEPEPEECETESESGTYMPDQTICAPEAEGEVYEGAVAYYSDADTSELDSGDWLALVGQMGLDMSTYQDRYVFTPSADFEGGFGLGISDDAMEARLHANMAPAAPPSEDGSAGVVTFYIDGGTLTVEDTVEGTTEVLHPQDDYYEYPVDLVEGGDTGDTGGDDTGPDDTGPDDTDDTAEVDDTDTDSGDSDTPDDTGTGGNGETPKDDGQGGCNSCASTPMPDASLAVFGLALAGTLMRRRKQ